MEPTVRDWKEGTTQLDLGQENELKELKREIFQTHKDSLRRKVDEYERNV